MQINIVNASKNYYDDMYAIHCSVMPKLDKMTKQNFYDEFKQETRKYFVALMNNQVIGYIGVLDTITDYNIMGIAVKKEFCNNGVGTLLIEHIKALAKQNNVQTISLEVDEANTIAINFYKKMKFVLTNIRKKYYKDNNAYIMWYYL